MFGGKNPSKELMDMCFIGVLLLSGYFLLGGSNSTLTLWLSLFFCQLFAFFVVVGMGRPSGNQCSVAYVQVSCTRE